MAILLQRSISQQVLKAKKERFLNDLLSECIDVLGQVLL
jgi:hypothetical protein